MTGRVVLSLLLLAVLCCSPAGAVLGGGRPVARLATAATASMQVRSRSAPERRQQRSEPAVVAAVLGGDVVTSTVTLGVMNAIQIFTFILYARFALSWFPQLPRQFPILQPINTVTEPYLRIFRQVIPPIAGFDISALPAIFLLDIFSQTAAAIGDSRAATRRLGVWSNKKQQALEARLRAAGVDYNGRAIAR